ncbi:MAG: hypothetical protein II879_01220 [Clostridia bacterium]|nr:hypothetical protein [Clostridia bacterium]
MKFKGLLTDRQPLVAALERETGTAAAYSGAPFFRYCVGAYTVLRDGSLEVPEEKADTAMIGRLAEAGLIDIGTARVKGIAFPTDNFTGRTMVNIVNCLSAREKLLNKAIGRPNAIHMGAELVRTLNAEKPDTMTAFMGILHRCGGEKAMRGLRLAGGRIAFTGFPDTDTYRALAGRIINAAVTRQWIKAKETGGGNDRYTFRVWLNALGMKGTDYAPARAELLKNLPGDSAFRTEEQRAAFYAARSRRAATPEPEFILL